MLRRILALAVIAAAFFLTVRERTAIQEEPSIGVSPAATPDVIQEVQCTDGECTVTEWDLTLGEATAATVFNGGRPTAATATTTPALAKTTVFTSVCGVAFVNRTTTALHLAPVLDSGDAASLTTSNSTTVCSGATCDHEDWFYTTSSNGTWAYRSESGSISIVIHYYRCNQ